MMTIFQQPCKGQICHCIVCVLVIWVGSADEANLSLGSSDAQGAWGRAVRCWGINFPASSNSPLPLSLQSSVCLKAFGTSSDEAAPSWSVCGPFFPGIMVNAKVLQTIFEAVFEPLHWPSDRSLSFTEFAVKKLLWNSVVVWNPSDMASSYNPVLPQFCLDTGKTCPFQYLCVRNFVLPRDV